MKKFVVLIITMFICTAVNINAKAEALQITDATAEALQITEPTSGIDSPNDPLFLIFPIPADDFVYIIYPWEEGMTADVLVVSMAGQLVGYEFNIIGGIIELDVSSLAPGVYNIILALSNGDIYGGKMIVV